MTRSKIFYRIAPCFERNTIHPLLIIQCFISCLLVAIKFGACGLLFVGLSALFLLLYCNNMMIPLIMVSLSCHCSFQVLLREKESFPLSKIAVKREQNVLFVVDVVFIFLLSFMIMGLIWIFENIWSLTSAPEIWYLEGHTSIFDCASPFLLSYLFSAIICRGLDPQI